jgi:hypothetical protein
MKTPSLLPSILLLAGSSTTLCAQMPPGAPPYTGLYVFGDSWSGTTDGAYWRSRWSNGPMWYDIRPEHPDLAVGLIACVGSGMDSQAALVMKSLTGSVTL